MSQTTGKALASVQLPLKTSVPCVHAAWLHTMAEVQHHDKARAAVSSTAFFVATLRNAETNRLAGAPLIHDPHAKVFFNEVSDAWIQNLSADVLEEMVNSVAVRTRFIDDTILDGLSRAHQIVVLGAGLDSRPWRLSPPSADRVRWFEVDFKEVLEYKRLALEVDNGAKPPAVTYMPIGANLCTDPWSALLVENGFDSTAPTIWLLEGFTGYLKEGELQDLFCTIKQLSAAGSELIATFVGCHFRSTHDMHRFITDEPLTHLAAWGWSKGDSWTIRELAAQLGRDGRIWDGYYIAKASMQ